MGIKSKIYWVLCSPWHSDIYEELCYFVVQEKGVNFPLYLIKERLVQRACLNEGLACEAETSGLSWGLVLGLLPTSA